MLSYEEINKPQSTKSPEETLEPCPLCGSTNLFLRDIAGWELDCRNCELSLVLADDPSREGLTERWNTRTPASTAPVVDEQALKKRARQIIDAVIESPVIVEVRAFSQPEEVDKLEDRVVALLRRFGIPVFEVAEVVRLVAERVFPNSANSIAIKELAQGVAAHFAAATAAPQVLFEAKLLGFGEGDRIGLCEPCLKRAIEDHLVSFSSALPAAPAVESNRLPHAFQEHPLYPNYCAFAVGDEDYCKRETDNVIHQVATAAPVEQSDEAANLLSEIDKTARQLLRPNRTPTDIDFAVEYIVSRVTALRRIVAKTVTSSTSARAAAEAIVKAWLWHTHEHDQERARKSIQEIIQKHCCPAAESVEKETQ